METIDWRRVLDIAEIIVTLIVLIGVKMKVWKESDFSIAKKVAEAGLVAGDSHSSIASDISGVTKLTAAQAVVEVREIKQDMAGKDKPLSKRVQRAGRKLLWRIFEGGL